MIEGQMGLNWPRWKVIVDLVESSGFAGLFRSDHFTNPTPPDHDSLELIVSLVYVADHTQRIHFGQLVSPISFRNPVFLARQAAAISDLSGGRMILGIGAGWQEREHETFGFDLGSVKERFQRLGEALEIITRLLRSDEPVVFRGKHFSVNGARISPKPALPVPVLLGGNGLKRSLPLAARYADWWNGSWGDAETFKGKSKLLDELLVTGSRKASDLKRTVMVPLFFGKDDAAAHERMGPLKNHPMMQGESPSRAVQIAAEHGMVAGSAERVKEQLDALKSSGVQEVMLQWFQLDDLEGLKEFAELLG